MLNVTLDPLSPTPLYHQIVQAVRWRIGTGALRGGDELPPIREAAEQWSVNYHTVRRAYRELVAEGWVESVQGSGTQVASVLPVDSVDGEDYLSQWLEEVVAIAHDRYGLSADGLAALVRERGRALRVVMVECNEHQSDFLARQLEREWRAEAIAWSLEKDGDPPQLPIIGTYFHYGEMRRRWPDRLGDMHFVALELDPGLRERVEAAALTRGTRTLRLVERDVATAREMAAGVAALFPGRFQIEPVIADPEDLLRSLPRDELLLIAPRLWDQLSAVTREDPRVFDVRHTVVREDLQRVWRSLATTASRASGRSGP